MTKEIRKRYTNYSIGILIYTLFMAFLYSYKQEFLFTKTGMVFLFEDAFIPGSVVFANYLFDRFYGHKMNPAKISKKALIKIFLSLLVLFGAGILTNEMELWVGFYDDDYISFGDDLRFNPYWTNVVTYLFFGAIFTVPAFYREGIIDFERFNLEKEKDRARSLSAELDVLQLQLYSANVKPHFIFNTLNGILTLIYESPQKAEELVVQLSDFLRSSLYSSNENDHSLSEELETVENYLQIEKIRFGDSISYEITSEEDLGAFMTPKFFLLPIVENAIKHNRESGNLHVRVNVHEKMDKIVVEVIDSGASFPDDLSWNAGIRGTDSILKSYFGDGYTLRFMDKPEKMVEITFSKRTSNA